MFNPLNIQLKKGVDYLSEGALTESMSYVFGPVLKLLRSYGYEDGVNLDAAPYDWRIPVSCCSLALQCQIVITQDSCNAYILITHLAEYS